MTGIDLFRTIGGTTYNQNVTFAQILSLCDSSDYMHAYNFFFSTGVLKRVAEAGEHSSRRSVGTCRLEGKLKLELNLIVDLLHFLHFSYIFL